MNIVLRNTFVKESLSKAGCSIRGTVLVCIYHSKDY